MTRGRRESEPRRPLAVREVVEGWAELPTAETGAQMSALAARTQEDEQEVDRVTFNRKEWLDARTSGRRPRVERGLATGCRHVAASYTWRSESAEWIAFCKRCRRSYPVTDEREAERIERMVAEYCDKNPLTD